MHQNLPCIGKYFHFSFRAFSGFHLTLNIAYSEALRWAKTSYFWGVTTYTSIFRVIVAWVSMMLAEWWFSSPLRPYTRLQKDLLYLFAYRTPDQEAGSFYFGRLLVLLLQLLHNIEAHSGCWTNHSFSRQLNHSNIFTEKFLVAEYFKNGNIQSITFGLRKNLIIFYTKLFSITRCRFVISKALDSNTK